MPRRHAFYGHVKRDRLEEYRERHRAVWPEMLAALTAAGFRNYSLYLRDDGLLFGYLECEDYDAALRRMAATDVNARWQRDMAPFFEIPPGKGPDECFVLLPEVFHLD